MNKLSPTILAVSLLCPPFAYGQIPQLDDPFFTSESAGFYDLNWQSSNGRTYFMQLSTNLSMWEYFPAIELGDGLPIAWTIDTSANSGHFLYRLRYTDAPTTNPDIEDFDGDGIPSLVEVAVLNTDPLAATVATDSDNDGLVDAWELYYWTSLAAQSGTGDADGDGLTNREEFDVALDPTRSEASSASSGSSPSERAAFTYDAAGRLTGLTSWESDTTWVSDNEGNILSAQ